MFDFSEEDEIVEIASKKQLKKFESPMVDDHRILKYSFLGYGKKISRVSILSNIYFLSFLQLKHISVLVVIF